MKILLMEDDAVLSDILLDYLRESYDVSYAYDSKAVYETLENEKFDLFIFDINVPGQNGLELLQELREFHDTTPAIVITAYTDTTYLKSAFERGANDYIKKPFELEELSARVQNIQRLFHIETQERVIINANVSFIPSQKQLIKDGKTLSLSAKDSLILSYFLNNAKRVVTNEELIQNIWDFDSMPSDATIRSHIRTIRELIGKEHLKTIRGEGYLYE